MEIRNELDQQGHRASGRLIDSITTDVVARGGTVIGKVLMEDYGRYLDTGTRPHYPPISELIDWAGSVKPGLSDRERRSFAFAVQRSIATHGTPTPGSFQFSKNGRRKDWSKYAIRNNLQRVRKMLNIAQIVRDRIA